MSRVNTIHFLNAITICMALISLNYGDTMNNYSIGQYVEYNGNQFIIVGKSSDGDLVKLNSPTLGRKQVSHKNITPMPYAPAKSITYRGNAYIVTVRGVIISRKTGRIMKWGKENGDRKAILQLHTEAMDNELAGG